ncbi:MAG: hypothetical protein H7061_00245, partial [Bdellovibrionaceae bacterium]|nr:hypothetical protein [Bdellovibrio sp.]
CLPLTSTPISFKKIWQGMDRLTGAGQSAYPFKDSHRVLELVKSSVGTAAWSADYTAFNQGTTGEALHLHSDGAAKIKTGTGVLTVNYWWPYGQSLISRAISSAACAKGINYFQPRTDDPILTSTNSDQRYSNHFFVIDFSLLNSPDQLTDIRVNFTQRAGTVTEFDLLLYEEGYVHTLDYSCAATNSNGACTNWQPIRSIANDVVRSDRRAGNITTKIIRNLNTLDQSKKYLLNIRAYTANKSISTITEYSYTIQDQNNENICP